MDPIRSVMTSLPRKWDSLGYRPLSTSLGSPRGRFADKDAESGRSCHTKLLPGRLGRMSTCPLLSFIIALVALPILVVGFFAMPGKHSTYAMNGSVIRLPDTDVDLHLQGGDQRLVIIIPANKPDPNLCKVITSAIALGYPSPIIVNWGTNFDELGYGSHLGKITGMLEYLETATAKEAHKGDKLDETDLVMLVDALDIWFQLPPQVLIHRYHENNRKANTRLRQQWETESADPSRPMPMEQTIIISAQKRCWPTLEDGSDLHCDLLPLSPLPPDLYGPDTDYFDETISPEGFRKLLPRFINSGSMIGPAGDMKRYFQRVKAKMDQGLEEHGSKLHSDQGIFGEVWGEQEMWRKWQRDREIANYDDSHNDDNSDDHNSEARSSSRIRSEYEFHVGMDYYQDLFIATVFEEHDGEIVRLNDQSKIDDYSEERGIVPTRLTGVPDDIKAARMPLREIPSTKWYHTSRSDWGAMPLYADFYTTAIPVVLHHNAHIEDLKSRREWWWDRTWYFPHLRELLDLQMKPAPLAPLATMSLSDGQDSGDLVYWAPASDEHRRKPREFDAEAMRGSGLQELELDMVCRWQDEDETWDRRWWDEVFRDDQGSM